MSRVRLTQLVTELASHAGLGPMASEVLALGEAAYQKRDYVFPRPGSKTLWQPSKVAREIAPVGDIDVREVLTRGAQSSEDLDVLCALTLLGVAASWPTEQKTQLELSHRLLWLETYSGLRCLSSAGAVLDGNRQRWLAEALLSLLEKPALLDVSEAAVGKAWLSSCTAPECQPFVAKVQSILVESPLSPIGSKGALHGNLGPKPRHCAITALLALTTVLFFERASRALGRLTLNYKTPASLVLGSRGLELSSRHELLGRVLKERRQIVPLEEIRQVVREVRYPRLGLYAGLAALTLGTLVGTRVFVDGLRVAGLSFTMMTWGALLILLGLGLDLLLSGFSDGVRGQCRVVVRTRGNGSFSLGSLNPREVDVLLSELALELNPR